MSLSADGGKTWTYHASPWDGLGGGQRLVVLRLRDPQAGQGKLGPILFCSFAKRMTLKDAAGKERTISGLFAALSYDEGKTWPVRKLISDFGPPRRMDGGGNTRAFVMSEYTGEPRGYMSICQTPDHLVHLISSKLHYTFNQKWVETPMPPAKHPRPGPLSRLLRVPPTKPANPATPKSLPAKADLAVVFRPTDLPSKHKAWRYTGSGAKEADQVSFPAGKPMTVTTRKGARCRWANDAREGFGAATGERGFSVEVRLQVTRSTSESRGVDLEACAYDKAGRPRRAMLTITPAAVLYNSGRFRTLAAKLDNHSGPRTYRLALREDGVVQIYRDGKLLGTYYTTSARDPLLTGRGSYLQVGEGAGGSEADFRLEYIAYDLGGPFAPK